MEARELRIGNYAQDQKGNLLKVIALNEIYHTFSVIDRSKYPLPDGWQAEPIPLSGYDLGELGFVRLAGKEGFFYKKGNIEIADISGCFIILHGVDNRFATPVKYVHELQNLFFDLVGYDLKFTKS